MTTRINPRLARVGSMFSSSYRTGSTRPTTHSARHPAGGSGSISELAPDANDLLAGCRSVVLVASGDPEDATSTVAQHGPTDFPVLDLFLYVVAVTTHGHSLHYTADEYIGADSIIGFSPTHHFFAVRWHDHDFYELAIVESGSGQHVIDAGMELIGRGTVVFVPPGVGHEYRACKDVRVYNCFFRAELDELELIWAFRDSHLRALFNPTGVYRSRSLRSRVIVSLDELELAEVLAALEAIRTADAMSRTRARELAHLLIVLDVIATAHRSGELFADRRTITPPVVTAALDALERDITFRWTLEGLSARLFVGPFHLSRTFGKWVGMPPLQYLAHRRAERAAVLLAGTDESVASIGASVGWSHPSHFSRRFNAAFGVSPRAYRRRHREEAPATARRPGPRSDVG